MRPSVGEMYPTIQDVYDFVAACVVANYVRHNPVPPGGCNCTICDNAISCARAMVVGERPESITRLMRAGMELAKSLYEARNGPCGHQTPVTGAFDAS